MLLSIVSPTCLEIAALDEADAGCWAGSKEVCSDEAIDLELGGSLLADTKSDRLGMPSKGQVGLFDVDDFCCPPSIGERSSTTFSTGAGGNGGRLAIDSMGMLFGRKMVGFETKMISKRARVQGSESESLPGEANSREIIFDAKPSGDGCVVLAPTRYRTAVVALARRLRAHGGRRLNNPASQSRLAASPDTPASPPIHAASP